MAKITYTDKDSFGQPPQNMVYDTDMNQIKDGVNALYGNVVTAIPEADATKAGERFWLNGTEWVYAYAGQFGSLAAGTPWPVKGYKEYAGTVNQAGTGNIIEDNIFINDINTITYSRDEVGKYLINGVDQKSAAFAQIAAGGVDQGADIVRVIYVSAELDFFDVSVYNAANELTDDWSALIQIKIYPPDPA